MVSGMKYGQINRNSGFPAGPPTQGGDREGRGEDQIAAGIYSLFPLIACARIAFLTTDTRTAAGKLCDLLTPPKPKFCSSCRQFCSWCSWASYCFITIAPIPGTMTMTPATICPSMSLTNSATAPKHSSSPRTTRQFIQLSLTLQRHPLCFSIRLTCRFPLLHPASLQAFSPSVHLPHSYNCLEIMPSASGWNHFSP